MNASVEKFREGDFTLEDESGREPYVKVDFDKLLTYKQTTQDNLHGNWQLSSTALT